MTKIECRGCTKDCFSLHVDFEPDYCEACEDQERMIERQHDNFREQKGF